MQHLRLVGVHEDGTLLLLTDDDGHRYALALDEALRAAARRDRPRLGQLQIEVAGSLRPRDVQALIRAGMSADEVAERAGWPVEKVHRYEGPILAEREHVATLARQVRLRARGGSSVGAPTLDARVSDRLRSREIDLGTVRWDSRRSQQGIWTVLARFTAGGRDREAAWQFDPQTRTATALDDEARWLSEDEEQQTPGPIPAPHLAASTRPSRVYDVEAEGGVGSDRRRDERQDGRRDDRYDDRYDDRGSSARDRRDDRREEYGDAAVRSGVSASVRRREAETVDLMAAMRERSSQRGRRRRPPATDVPGLDAAPAEAAPLEKLAADPREQLPPAAHAHPSDDPEVHHEAVEDGRGSTTAERPAPASEDAARTRRRTERTQPVHRPAAEAHDRAEAHDTDGDGRDADGSLDEPAGRRRSDGGAPTGPAASETVAARDESHDDLGDGADVDDLDELVEERAAAPDPAPAPRKAGSTRRSGRPSVPSWDDIMFGRRND